MDLAFLVYGISVLGKFNFLVSLTTILSIIICTISVIAWTAESAYFKETIETATKWAKISSIIAITSALIHVILPSEKVAYTMVGAYAAQKVAEDPRVQQLSGKVLKIVENKLDEYISEEAKK